MKTIPLTQGKVALVDDSDYDELSRYKWRLCRNYAGRTVNNRVWFMHREILNTPDGMVSDHINGNCLDNRRSNLRICTVAENNRNRRGNLGTSSQYRGVAKRQDSKKWQAHIRLDGYLHYLGLYATEEDAARAYDASALEAWGEYARLNFPGGALGQSLSAMSISTIG